MYLSHRFLDDATITPKFYSGKYGVETTGNYCGSGPTLLSWYELYFAGAALLIALLLLLPLHATPLGPTARLSVI